MNNPVAVRKNTVQGINEFGNFKQLIVGAGSTIFKSNKEGVFAGGVNYSSAKLKISYTGNLGLAGRLDFLYGSTSKGAIYVNSSGIVTIESLGSAGAWFTNTSQFYVKNDIVSQNGKIIAYNDIISQHGSISALTDIYSTGGSMHTNGHDIYADDASVWCYKDMYSTHGSVWAYNDIYTNNGNIHAYGTGGGGSIYANGNFGTVDGNIYTNNGWISAGGYFNCQGEDGSTGTFTDGGGNTITVKGGIITDGL